jgi:large subunit ribosomal protein L25
MHELEVTVKAIDIPSDITFDVAELHLGDRLHLSDVELPEGLTVDLAFDPVIASVIAPKALLVKEDEEETEEEGTEEEAAEGTEAPSEE